VQLLTYAQTALSVAQAALPGVGRYLLAGGPELALVCHQVAVYPGPVTTVRFAPCAFRADPQIVVAYSKDCYPMVQTSPTLQLPDPAEVTDWTEQWLTDVQTLYAALLTEALGDSFGDGDGCAGARVEVANFSGPRGGVCTVRIPLTILTG
jgi:hypothetical protein